MAKLTIDINCDMGESFGNYQIGNDEKVFPYISSSNIACGFHGGDPLVMERTLRQAIEHGVQIGAHPSYPDRSGFGRRKMDVDKQELKAIIKYQIAAIQGMAQSLNAKVSYVKPHGALYNRAASDPIEAATILNAIHEIDPELILMGLAGSLVEAMAHEKGQPFIAEAFADRRYDKKGQLVARSIPNSVIHDPNKAAEQVLSIIKNHKVQSIEGHEVVVNAQSICIHGDNPQVIELLKAIDQKLAAHGIVKQAF